MAESTLQLVAKVKDMASRPLKNIDKSVNRAQKSVGGFRERIKNFNQTLFTATAVANTFASAFRGMSDIMLEGARVDRVIQQFERRLGPKGELFETIDGMTNAVVDKVEAMRSGIALQTLGLAKDQKDVADITTKSALAARAAGLESAEGIQRVTRALKSGSLAQLEFLNRIRTNNPALKALFAVMEKGAGVMGTAISAQEKHNMILRAITAAANEARKGHADLLDILLKLKDSFVLLKSEVGTFLGESIRPMLKGSVSLMDSLRSLLETVNNSESGIRFLARSMMVATTATLAFYGAMLTLHFGTLLLGKTGLGGIPFLTTAIAGLAFMFQSVTDNTGDFVDRLKLFGNFLKGTFQLVTRFFEPENFARGISTMDKAVADKLNPTLMNMATNLSRIIITASRFFRGMGRGARVVIDFVTDKIEILANKFKELLGLDIQSWSRGIFSSAESVGKVIGALASGFVGLAAAIKLLRGIGGIFGKIPVVGRFFGRGAGREGPRGTASDPIYTANITGAVATRAATTGRSVLAITGAGAAGVLIGKAMRAQLNEWTEGGWDKAVDDFWMKAFRWLDELSALDVFGRDKRELLQSEEAQKITSMMRQISPKRISQDSALAFTKTFRDQFRPEFETQQGAMEAFKRAMQANLLMGKSMPGLIDQMKLARAKGEPFLPLGEPDRLRGGKGVQLPGIGEKGFTREQLGLGPEGERVATVPQMPITEERRIKKAKAAIQSLEQAGSEAIAKSMTKALREAREDGVINKDEWVEIMRLGMDTSKVGEQAKKESQKGEGPNTDAAKVKRDC